MIAISLLLIAFTLLLPKLISPHRLTVLMASRKFPLIVHSISVLNVTIIFSVIYITLQDNEASTQANMQKNLEYVVEATKKRLNDWVNNQEKLLEQLSADDKVIALTKQLLEQPSIRDELIKTLPLQNIRQHIRQSSIDGQGFFIINRDHINIASSRNENLGAVNLIAQQHPDILQAVFAGETRFVPPLKSDVSLSFGNTSKIYRPV